MSVLLSANSFTDSVTNPGSSSHALLAVGNYMISAVALNIALFQGSVASDTFNLDFQANGSPFYRNAVTPGGAGVFIGPNLFYPFTWPNGLLLLASAITIGINGVSGAGSTVICQYAFNLYGVKLP